MQAGSRIRTLARTVAAVAVGVALVLGSRLGVPEAHPGAPPPPSIEPSATVLLAVGDIGSCDGTADEAVSALATRLPGIIALLGDIAYQDGSATDYANCFDPAWRSLRPRLRPVPGNHDYQTPDASAYFSYFGAVAGTPGEGWYSYEVGAWHVIALNSNCAAVGGCGPGSPQLAWLKTDLASHSSACTLAYWHHSRYSSGRHGSDDMTEPLWQALASAGADVVLEGHDHDYERLAPVDGIRSFVVGTGGRSLYEWRRPRLGVTELRANDSYGLLMLQLGEAGYTWSFEPITGDTLTDSGSASCH